MSSITGVPRTRFALVGAGRVGTAISFHLQRAGHEPVAVASRSDDSAARAAEVLDAPVLPWPPPELPEVDVVLLGVTEGAIDGVAHLIASQVRARTIVVHFAGAFGLEVLRPATAVGARGAALHPVQAVSSVETGIERLPGSAWGVTCEPDLHEWCHALIADDLKGTPSDVPESARPMWHAASVTTSNGLAALLSVGERILSSLGVKAPERVLGPLAAGTLQNAIEGGGGVATLTGPIVRGEAATIERHLRAFEASPELLLPYKRIAAVVLEEAIAGERITEETANEMRKLLEEDR